MSYFCDSNIAAKEHFLPENVPKNAAFLDDSTSKKTFQKKARSKFFTIPIATSLAELRSPLEKSYRNTIYCAYNLEQNGLKISGKYCGNRWCSVCSRIRTAKMINGYLPELERMKEKYFVTLTLRNCEAENLKETIIKMKEISKKIRDALRNRANRKNKEGPIIRGLEKLECTWNYKTNTYHPHFHFIVDGKESSELLKKMWMAHLPADTDKKAQKIEKCWDNSEKEIFKYFSKIVTKVGKDFRIYVESLDVIFTAMRGMRVYSSLGLKKEVSEDLDELQSEIVDITADKRVFTWIKEDWHEITEDGEVLRALSGYTASDAMVKITNSIVKPEAPQIDIEMTTPDTILSDLLKDYRMEKDEERIEELIKYFQK
jgi:Replication protein